MAAASTRRDRATRGCTTPTVVIDPTGEIIARYSKIHMFDVVLDGVAEYRESATVTPGDEIVVTEIDGIPVGLAICYDLRFPELFRILALKGAQAIMLPAAFTLDDRQGSLGDADPRPRHRKRALHDRPRAVGHAPARELVLWTVDGGRPVGHGGDDRARRRRYRPRHRRSVACRSCPPPDSIAGEPAP